jgi:hypothetical protein
MIAKDVASRNMTYEKILITACTLETLVKSGAAQ